MTGTMGLDLAAFVPVWTLMMAAIMLPSVTPTATLYAKTMQRNRTARIAGLVAGTAAIGARTTVQAKGLSPVDQLLPQGKLPAPIGRQR